jgi:hypothetical protein
VEEKEEEEDEERRRDGRQCVSRLACPLSPTRFLSRPSSRPPSLLPPSLPPSHPLSPFPPQAASSRTLL